MDVIDSNLTHLVILLVLFVPSITVHEFAHAVVAHTLGDRTPQRHGRLTLNPLAHLDPIGTLCLLFAGFGWAKPVPVTTWDLRHPRLAECLIALAGPASNLLLAWLTLWLYTHATTKPSPEASLLLAGFSLNVTLAVFNMLPVPPLDGGHLIANLIPERHRARYEALLPYGILIVLLMVFVPALNQPLVLLNQSVRQLIIKAV